MRASITLAFVGDDVAASKVGVVEDGAEEPLGQQVLDQHLLDRGLGQVWVDRLAAFVQKLGEGGGEAAVALPLLPDQLRQAVPDVGHPLLELGDRLLPRRVLLRAVAEEHLQRLDQLRRVRQVGVQRQPPVLPQQRPLRRLEENVVARVAGRELALDLGRQVVVDVLGLPVAVRQPEIIDQRAVYDDAPVALRADGVFRHQRPAALAGAVFEQSLECGAHRALMLNVEACELVKCSVVGLDRLVRGFEVEGGHGDWVGVNCGGVGFDYNTTLAGIQVTPWARLEVKGRCCFSATEISLHVLGELLHCTP